MFELVDGIANRVRREFGLSRYNEYWYRNPHGRNGRCPSCRRYFELLDACVVRIGG